jgi:cyclic pyranopterin phosphate synthase
LYGEDVMSEGPFVPLTKILYHLDRLHEWSCKGITIPITVKIYPSYKCNSNCNFCLFKNKDDVVMSEELLMKVVKEVGEFGARGINWSGGGEPTLCPCIGKGIEEASNYGISQGMFTNGIHLTEELTRMVVENLEWIKIAQNAGTRKNYLEMMGVDKFDDVVKNMDMLVKLKKETGSDITIGSGMIVNKNNIQEVLSAIVVAQDVGVDYFQIKPDIFMSPEETHLIFVKLNLINKDNFKIRVLIPKYKFNESESYKYGICCSHEFITIVGAEGKVWTCCDLCNDGEHWYGDLKDKSFDIIWFSKRRKDIIDNLNIESCRLHCKANELNEFLWSIKDVDESTHPNHL